MSVPYRLRPGAGFLTLVAVALLSVSFFAWGLSRPALDEVWRLGLELELGKRGPLSREELAKLQRAVCRHPGIAEDLSGRVLVRDASRPAVGVVVAPLRGMKTERLKVSARTVDAEREGVASDVEPFTWVPPSHRDCPTVIEVVVGDGKKKARNTRVLLKELAP